MYFTIISKIDGRCMDFTFHCGIIANFLSPFILISSLLFFFCCFYFYSSVCLSLSHTHTHTCSFHHELPSEAFASPLHIPDEESMRADYTPPESPVPAIFDLTSIPINDNTQSSPINEHV
jgi:hypothetical protein